MPSSPRSNVAAGLLVLLAPGLALGGGSRCPDRIFEGLRRELREQREAPRSVAAIARPELFTQARLHGLLSDILETHDPKALDAASRDFNGAVEGALKARSAALLKRDATAGTDWPKDSVEYMFYPDQFGVKGGAGTFWDAAKMIPYLKRLGADVLYPLPFLRSAGLDGGFDVINFRGVEPRLGGDAAFEAFLKEAGKYGMKVQMDLILNHVSDQHEWFQKLLKGDLRYKDFFVTRDTPPVILRRGEDDTGKFVVYREKDAKGNPIEVKRRLIFPEISDSHYREITLPGGKHLWVYHTFYPFQLDLNYSNPAVLKEAYGIMGQWANKGVSIFRLDAIPFLDKTAENHSRTHDVVQLMSSYLKHIAPSARLKVEACQKLDDIVAYFGRDMRLAVERKGPRGDAHLQTVETPSEAQIAYQFEGMTNTWLSLMSGDKRYYDDFITRLSKLKIPKSAIWAIILRVHDELTLEMVPEPHKHVLQDSLIVTGRGVSFREGNGVSGRMANFLGNDRDRIRQAFALLMSQDGMPIIYFGDEIAAQNNLKFMASEEARREAYLKKAGIGVLSSRDTRDAGRGPQAEEEFKSAADGRGPKLANQTYETVRRIIAARKASVAMRRGRTELISNDRENVISYFRIDDDSHEKVMVVNNLSDRPTRVRLDVGDAFGTVGELKLKDLLTGRVRTARIVNGQVDFDLGRYDSLWLG